MADIVNLRQARKRKRRDEKERTAEANRLAHGLTSLERNEARLKRDLDVSRLEGHKRQPSGDRGGEG